MMNIVRRRSLFIAAYPDIVVKLRLATIAIVTLFAMIALSLATTMRAEAANEIATPDDVMQPIDIIPSELAKMELPEPDLNVVEPVAPAPAILRDLGQGEASYYGARFAGRRTANGEIFDPSALTAAHRTLPMGSKVRVTNVRNGNSVVVRINDRGPYHGNRVIDLSKAAASQIGLIQSGRGQVKLQLVD